MAQSSYDSSYDDRRSRSRSSRNSSRSSRSRNRSQSRGRQSSRNTSNTSSRRGTLQRPDTGYSLHSRRVRRDPRTNQGLAVLLRPRVLVFILIVLVVIVALVLGVTSCIRRNDEASHAKVEETKPKNEQDDRVAAGVSAAMTSRFTEALDQGELLASIAEHADEYSDDRLLSLALTEPSSLVFVANYPSSDKSSSYYAEEVTRGQVPLLYNWDEHWGAVTYGDGPLAVTGSGPTVLSMAYMGLTGKTDKSPTEVAQQANKMSYAGNDSGSKGELFAKLPESIGLTSTSYEPAYETLYALGENTVFAVEVREGTLTDAAHWVLVVNINEDGSVTVFDPTSTAVSSRPWDMGTITNASTIFYALSASDDTIRQLDNEAKSQATSSRTSTTSSSKSSGTSDDDAEEDGEEEEGEDSSY